MQRSSVVRVALVALLVLVPGSRSFARPCAESANGPPTAVDVVFVLDVTGSMGSMIEDAKATIWSVANEVVGLSGGAPLRFGVVFFRDRGDAFVTRRVELNRDLDAVYARLIETRAGGGGDGPESVNQALHEAVGDTAWAPDPGARRVIFLVGDAPPHEDYPDDTSWSISCARAREQGIPINAIRYGDNPDTGRIWNEIAACSGAATFRVQRAAAAADRSTPFDYQLAAHARLLDATVVAYGDPGRAGADRERRERAAAIEEGSSEAALADRAAYKATKAGRAALATHDLISDIAEGRVTLESLDESALPEELRRLAPDRRRQLIDDRIEQRRGILSEIAHFREKRDKHLEAGRAETRGDFDSAIVEALRCQIGGVPPTANR